MASQVSGDLFARTAPYGTSDGATFSSDRRYRYRLWRWAMGSPEHRVVFVGLNPSKADEVDNDTTISKCVEFARRWGFGAIDMVNLFALVSTDPSGLLTAADPIGPGNDEVLADAFDNAHRIVWAWGSHNRAVNALVQKRISGSPWLNIRKRCEVGTLGHTQDGSPRHPSRLAYATRFEVSR